MNDIPLAERMRPKSVKEFVGQEHLCGKNGLLTKLIDSGRIPSLILWGPPGVGKTTLAKIMANTIETEFFELSAVSSGVKQVREILERAEKFNMFNTSRPILFIDEIHRFSKNQQDSLLAAVEKGVVTLIGATTENPSFEVISPLLSRCQTLILYHLKEEDLYHILENAISTDNVLKNIDIEIKEGEQLINFSGGDARKLLNCLELIVQHAAKNKKIIINDKLTKSVLKDNPLIYDKQADMHYDLISAFIKSIRGSDPNATIYYMSRMLLGGEDPKFICRRMIISAAEDIGLANANALLLANQCFEAVQKIGMPEGRIVMSQTAIYLATSEKSNSSYMAIQAGYRTVKETGNLPVPLKLRNKPTKLMKNLGYGQGYKYAHDFEENFVVDDYLPEKISRKTLYKPKNNSFEEKVKNRLKDLWKNFYDWN